MILRFWDTNESPNLSQTSRHSDSRQKEKRTYQIADLAIPSDHRVKLEESEKGYKYVDLGTELKINYGTWMWMWYELQLAHSVPSLKDQYSNWRIRK